MSRLGSWLRLNISTAAGSDEGGAMCESVDSQSILEEGRHLLVRILELRIVYYNQSG